jgi:hypothetical protein
VAYVQRAQERGDHHFRSYRWHHDEGYHYHRHHHHGWSHRWNRNVDDIRIDIGDGGIYLND